MIRNSRRRVDATRLAAVVGGWLLIFSTSAAAHSGTGLPGGILSGFGHPFAGFDHLLAMVSVGLWGSVLGRPLLYALPVIFPVVMVGGAVIGMLGMRVPPVEIIIALSVWVLGGCIALSLKAPVWLASLIVATFAVFHGYAHGKELPSAADPIGYSGGFVLATGLLHLVGIGIGSLTNLPGGMVAMRSVGAAVAVTGVWFFYKAVGA